MSSPGITGSGELEVLVTERAALPNTVVEVVALLLLSLTSFCADTVAVLKISVPDGVCEATATVRVNTTLPGESDGAVQETSPLVPTVGKVQVHPAGSGMETKVVSAGSASKRLTAVASI